MRPPNHIIKSINRKLDLLAGYCCCIADREVQEKAGKTLTEIQDTDLLELLSLIKRKNGKTDKI